MSSTTTVESKKMTQGNVHNKVRPSFYWIKMERKYCIFLISIVFDIFLKNSKIFGTMCRPSRVCPVNDPGNKLV